MKPKRFKDELPPANTPFWYTERAGEFSKWYPHSGTEIPNNWRKLTGHWTTDGITEPPPFKPEIPKLLGVEGGVHGPVKLHGPVRITRGEVWWVEWEADCEPHWAVNGPNAPSKTEAIEAAIKFVEDLRNDLE